MTKKTSQSKQSGSRASRQEARRQKAKQRQQRRAIGIVVIVVAVIAALALVVWTTRPEPITIEEVRTEQPANADGLAWGGPEGAAVTIVDYSDFQCGFCGRHALNTVPQLIERYANNPNVRYEYRPFVLFQGGASMDASQAALCAAEQDMFWPLHDTMFANQGGEASGVFTNENLKSMASAAGLDTSQFNDCLDSGSQRRTVNDIVAEGRARGVTSTPTFFINGQELSGAQPVAAFVDAIETALAEAGVQ
ncbi:MAG: thioredoxin domain-containing protein [Chloroflexi bacterium]|nr:thioredoxin domain-containing protein [Chloroflexota bacterium]